MLLQFSCRFALLCADCFPRNIKIDLLRRVRLIFFHLPAFQFPRTGYRNVRWWRSWSFWLNTSISKLATSSLRANVYPSDSRICDQSTPLGLEWTRYFSWLLLGALALPISQTQQKNLRLKHRSEHTKCFKKFRRFCWIPVGTVSKHLQNRCFKISSKTSTVSRSFTGWIVISDRVDSG